MNDEKKQVADQAEADADVAGLIEAVRKGEEALEEAEDALEEALNRLWGVARPWLQWQARNTVGGPIRRKVDESDLVQMTLVQAAGRFRKFHGKTSGEFWEWLRKIFQNEYNDIRDAFSTHKRDIHREQPLNAGHSDSSSGIYPLVGPDPPPVERIMRREEVSALLEQVDRLSSRQRQVVILRIWHNLQFKDIGRIICEPGERVQDPEDAASKLYARAVEKLKELRAESEGGR
jgi:RNA polymerase sigma-70 factor (subfamily 1)